MKPMPEVEHIGQHGHMYSS